MSRLVRENSSETRRSSSGGRSWAACRQAARALAVAGLLSACGGDSGGGNSIIVSPDGAFDAATDARPTADATGTDDRGQVRDQGTPADARPGDAAPVGGTVTPADAQPDAAPDAADAEIPPPACRNGADDDADGLTDYPADLGCETPEDTDEVDPETLACADRIDNDDDGVSDLEDPGCSTLQDPNEANDCGPMQVFRDVTGQRTVNGTTVGAAAVFDAGCRTNLAPEAVHKVTLRAGLRALEVDTAGSSFDTVVSIRTVCDALDSELLCNDDQRPGIRTSLARLESPAAGDYFVVVDGFRDGAGPYQLAIRAEVADGEACPPDEGFEVCGKGSLCVDGTCTRSECFNNRDDDLDGRRDYPLDPGCDDPSDTDEVDPAVTPQCANGSDDDFNGTADYPDDPGCEDAADDTEEPLPDCSNGADDDEDGLIDLADPGCRGNPEWPFEFNTAACRDGQDNDGDGRTDYPFDPGCDSLEDALEIDPDVLPECADVVDNDGNGETDYPADAAGCVSAADNLESPPCDAVMPTDITGQADVRGNTEAAGNDFAASCVAATGPEVVFNWRVAPDRALQGLRLSARGSRFDTILSAREQCEPEPGADLACADFGAQDGAAELILGPQAPGTDLWIFLDTNSGAAAGIYRLRVTALLEMGATCGDADVWTCGEGLVCREGTCQVPACGDAVDNDRDGVTDWPLEPGCAALTDDDETDPETPAACSNREDDDQNGFIDYPADPGCAGAGDESELAECSDGVDNDGNLSLDFDRDGDGFRDRNSDPQCACAIDPHEGPDPECGDGCDNDGDGLIDLTDPGCEGDAAHPSEVNVPHCRDARDNDGDGYVDFPNDPGCTTLDTALEDDPGLPPQCADGADNDGDGLFDYPGHGDGPFEDGCTSAADTDERGPCDTPKPDFPAVGQALGDTTNFQDEFDGECSFSDGAPDAVYVSNIPFPAHVVVDSNGSAFDTLLYARRSCAAEVFCPPPPVAEDAGVAPADAATDAATDAGTLDAAAPAADALPPPVDAAPPAPDAAAGPVCEPGSTELACDDDGGDGAQSRLEFDWPGGPLHIILDGFGSNRGPYTLNLVVTFPAGGSCDPAAPAYMRCEAGTVCTAGADGSARCEP